MRIPAPLLTPDGLQDGYCRKLISFSGTPSAHMSDTENRYSHQRERLCSIVIGRMGMKLYIEQLDKPYSLIFKLFGAEGAVPMAVPVEEMERMSDTQLAASIRAKLGLL
jgi:hypothetical protein